MQTLAAAEAEILALRRDRIRRLDAVGQVARTGLRAAAACCVVAGWLLVPQAAVIAWIIQAAIIGHADIRALQTALAVLLLVSMVRAGFGWISRRRADAAVEAIRLHLRGEVIRRLSAAGPLWLRQRRSGELAELMGSHVDAMEGYFGGYRLARIEAVAVPLLILLSVFFVDRVVGTLLLVTLPLIPMFMMLVGWGAEAASRRQLQALARMGGHFADRLRGLGLIRLYGRGDAELSSVREAAEGVRVRSLKVLRIAFLSSAVLEFFASLGVAMVAVYLGLSYLGMLDLRATPLSLGMGVFCLLLAPEYYAPLRRLAAHYHDRANALAALDEIETAFAGVGPARGAFASSVRKASRTGPAPTITIDPDVLHARSLFLRPLGSSREVLANLSFDLPAGTHLALAGPSGCGKSTLLDALAGWLEPSAGMLLLPADLRIGYAPQRPYLFHGSLADNLRIADPQATDEALHAAAEAAQVMRFANRLPQGLDTVVGERGFGLSGGEVRRVALARVFLRDPHLLLLDEPTAFLDPETEEALLASLARFARGRTLVLATHSQAAMRMVGKVLWLPEAVMADAGERG